MEKRAPLGLERQKVVGEDVFVHHAAALRTTPQHSRTRIKFVPPDAKCGKARQASGTVLRSYAAHR